RSLKEFVTCRFSYFTQTSAPVSPERFGAANMGVRRTWPWMTRPAALIASSVTMRPNSGAPALPMDQAGKKISPSVQQVGVDKRFGQGAAAPRARAITAHAPCARTAFLPFAGGFRDSRRTDHE